MTSPTNLARFRASAAMTDRELSALSALYSIARRLDRASHIAPPDSSIRQLCKVIVADILRVVATIEQSAEAERAGEPAPANDATPTTLGA